MLGPPDATGPYPELTPEQRELAERLSREMVERLKPSFGALLTEAYADVRALVALAATRNRGALGRFEP